MSFFSRYINGDWNAICDVCGRKFKNTLLKQRWDGLMCCPQDWEIRQPQDFVRGVPDPQLVPWVRDEAQDQYIPVSMIQWLLTYLSSTVTLIVSRIKAKPILTYNSTTTAILSRITQIFTGKALDSSTINKKTLG